MASMGCFMVEGDDLFHVADLVRRGISIETTGRVRRFVFVVAKRDILDLIFPFSFSERYRTLNL